MTRLELIKELERRRLNAENSRRNADRDKNLIAFSDAFGRIREIDDIIAILKTNLITE